MKDALPKLKPIHVRMSKAMIEEIKKEERRTGNTRSSLIRTAWAEYMERRATPKKTA